MSIKGMIFDLDGTLLDSMFIWEGLGERYLLNKGIVPEKGLNKKLETMSLAQAAQYYQIHYKINHRVETIMADINDLLADFYANIVVPKDGVIDMLKKFQQCDVAMCIATASDRPLVEQALKRTGMDGFFSHILTCTEVGDGKDSPLIFERALAVIGTKKEETLVFEDTLHAIETAKAAGFKVVAVYDKASKDNENKIKEISDYYLASYRDWSEIIK